VTPLHLELTAFRDRDGQPRIVLRERGETKTYGGDLAVGRAMTALNARLHQTMGQQTSIAQRGEGGRRAGKGPAGRRVHQGSARPGEDKRAAFYDWELKPDGTLELLLDEAQGFTTQSLCDPGKLRAPAPDLPELGADADGEPRRDLEGHDHEERRSARVEARPAREAGVGHDVDAGRGAAPTADHGGEGFVPHAAQHGSASTRGEGA